MANLETLFIEIDGNASKASSGIESLISSLSSLGSEIGKQIGSIRNLASSLQDIRGAAVGGNIWKNLAPPTTAVKKATTAAQEVSKAWADTNKVVTQRTGGFSGWNKSTILKYDPQAGAFSNIITKGYKVSDNSNRVKAADALGFKDGKITKVVEETKRASVAFADEAKSVQKATTVVTEYKKQADTTVKVTEKAAKSVEKTTASVAECKKEVEATAKETDKATKNTKQYAEATKEVKKSSESVKKAHSTTRGLLSQIGRIAKTMLIRTAIRSVMKVAREGLNNFYEYSKAVSNSYASAIDSMKTSAGTAGNQIGAALGTLLTSIMPIVNTIVSVISSVAEAITMLFALLGGGTTYTKAVNGFESVGKSAGGAGKKIKELLADFDELNVISQESGGGGGGAGGTNFGGMFEEAELPQWMLEWKPLIEALLAGGLGALLLPSLLKLLGGLFGGSDWLDILKHYFKKDWLPDDDMDDLIPDQPDYKPFPEQPDYKPFPIQPDYKPFPVAPDYGKAATDMGILSAAAIAAAPAVEAIVVALEKLKTGISLVDVLKTLLTALISKLGGNTIKIKVDRKEFDKFKKEYDDWKKGKSINIKFDNAQLLVFNGIVNSIGEWLNKEETKAISVGFDRTLEVFNFTAKGVSDWAKSKETKVVSVGFDKTLEVFNFTARGISNWVNSKETKAISVGFNDTLNVFNFTARGITNWVNSLETKLISVGFNNTLEVFNFTARGISQWVSSMETKRISIAFANYAEFLMIASSLALYCEMSLTKPINIVIANIASFVEFVGSLNEWAAESLTKHVTIVVTQTGNTEANDVVETAMNGFKNIQSTVGNFANNLWSGNKKSSSNNGGILEQAWNGVKNFVSDAWKTIFGNGFAEGGFPISGDLFVANESSAELIGSLNGRTAVVNNDQIIEGITSGVERANSEQNALLRQQNELLRGILEKDASVRIGASAALGRVARQSLDMYGSMIGG